MHLRPDRLRRHAATAAALTEALDGLGAPADAGVVTTPLRRARSELAELRAALLAAADGAEAADREAARAVGQVAWP